MGNELTGFTGVLEMSEWQTIDTAPKDGTSFIGWSDDWPGPEGIRWEENWGEWVLSGVLLRLGDVEPPSHWQHWPEPPK